MKHRGELERLRGDRRKRAEWIDEDPSKLFRLLALDEPTPEDHAEFERRLAIALQQPQTATVRSRWPWVAAAAMLALAVWTGATYLSGPEAPPATVASGSTSPDAPRPSFEPIQPTAFRDESLHGVQVLDTPGEARVVDLSIGETRVVMIFDEELDL